MIIKNANVIFPNHIEKTSIKVEGEIISEIGNVSNSNEFFDAEGLYISPGFIDIHTHGGMGIDFLDDVPFDDALIFHAKSGTTSLLPTALTSPPDRIRKFSERVRQEMKISPIARGGSRILGAHIEGPYLSKKNKGAQPENCLLTPSLDSYTFLTDNKDVIKTVTISPELDGAQKMIRDLKNAGIIVCGGHDDGKKSTLIDSIDAGLSHLTHLWCAMSTVGMYDGMREPGLVEIGLTNDNLTAEIIADNHHMPPELVKIAYRCKGATKLCIVSDSLRAGGMPADERLWALGPEKDKLSEFIVSDGVARLPNNTRLAGSIQPLLQMVSNLVKDCGISLTDAVRMASLTPAEIIGVENKLGSVKVGKIADLCLFDEDFKMHAVFIDGIRIY